MTRNFELKSYLMKDFSNNKYKSISLIELYASDYKYFVALEKKHLIADEAMQFFREKDAAIKATKMIPSYAFRKLRYEQIIDDYLDNKNDVDSLCQKTTSQTSENAIEHHSAEKVLASENKEGMSKENIEIGKPVFSTSIHKVKTLHCINDGSILRSVGGRNAIIIKAGKKMSFPKYECPSCKRKYTSLQDYKDLQTITFAGIKYTNITEAKDSERYIAYLQMSHAFNPCTICYAYGTNEPTLCRVCGKDLLNASTIITEKCDSSTYLAKFCKTCKIYYVPYNLFVAHKNEWLLLNENEIPEIQEELQIKAEENVNRNTAREAAKALKQKEEKLIRQQAEKERLERERHLKRMQEIEERGKERLERERIVNEEINRKLRELVLQLEQKCNNRVERPQEHNQLNEHANSIRAKDFVVRRTTFKCRHKEHKLQNIDAVISIIDKDGNVKQDTVPAGYCPNCNVFFIMESTYQSLKNRGTPICRVSDEKAYLSSNSFVNGMQLAQESVLMQYGYSVSQEEGLTTARRRKILARMIDNNILTRSDIISYLDFFINQRKNQHRFEKAIAKWESDREFVSEYKSGSYSKYGVSRIHRKY